jgi:putative Holliday junction resolvase
VSGFRPGVRLGIDVGKARIGVARCDRDGLLAVPVETVPRTDAAAHRALAEYEAMELLVGLPISLSGGETASTRMRAPSRGARRAASGAGGPPRG